MTTILMILILILCTINIFITVYFLKNKNNEEQTSNLISKIESKLNENNSKIVLEIIEQNQKTEKEIISLLNEMLQKIYQMNNSSYDNLKENITNILYKQNSEQNALLKEIMDRNNKAQQQTNEILSNNLSNMTRDIRISIDKGYSDTENSRKETIETLNKIMISNQEAQNNLTKTIFDALSEIRKTNEMKLNEINKSVSDKLDKSLNERLDSTFGQIGDRLNSLYESLGEIHKLSSGVTDLNKTLSNVKTRGIWGEIQLQGILEDTMTPAQYDTNIITKKNSQDRVEFAIKIPSKSDDSEFIYLPIDSKFPADIYGKIVEASETNNSEMLRSSTKELEQRIKQEARTIRNKYIDPPNTTDFAIMFLPTESLYSEVLRIDGLYEWCQSNCKIIISGPTTITALLNSLRVGFSNLTLNKKTKEVIKVLQAVKTQYEKLDELISKTEKKLNEAVNSTSQLKDRTRIINSKMSKIELIDSKESEELLGIPTNITEEDY